jgi:hypothetical protein
MHEAEAVMKSARCVELRSRADGLITHSRTSSDVAMQQQSTNAWGRWHAMALGRCVIACMHGPRSSLRSADQHASGVDPCRVHDVESHQHRVVLDKASLRPHTPLRVLLLTFVNVRNRMRLVRSCVAAQ